MIYVTLALFAISMLIVLLTYTPWVQENFKWMTSLYFYTAVGLVLGLSVVIAIYLVAHNLITISPNKG